MSQGIAESPGRQGRNAGNAVFLEAEERRNPLAEIGASAEVFC
jgi:hypothetical protein